MSIIRFNDDFIFVYRDDNLMVYTINIWGSKWNIKWDIKCIFEWRGLGLGVSVSDIGVFKDEIYILVGNDILYCIDLCFIRDDHNDRPYGTLESYVGRGVTRLDIPGSVDDFVQYREKVGFKCGRQIFYRSGEYFKTIYSLRSNQSSVRQDTFRVDRIFNAKVDKNADECKTCMFKFDGYDLNLVCSDAEADSTFRGQGVNFVYDILQKLYKENDA